MANNGDSSITLTLASSPAPGIWKPINPRRVGLPVEMRVGRSSGGTQPDPPSMSFTWLGPDCPFQPGSKIQATAVGVAAGASHPTGWLNKDPWASSILNWGARGTPVSSVRFVGEVQQMVAIESEWAVREWRIHCAGDMPRRFQNLISLIRPEESDVSRVQAIAATIGETVNIAGTSSVLLIAHTAANPLQGSALELLYQIAESTGALVWQDELGRVWYGTANHRAGNPTHVFDASWILDGLQWNQNVAELVNEVAITYGYEPVDAEGQPTGERPIENWENAPSIGMFGHRAVAIDTELLDYASAATFALTVLARRMIPFWVVPGIHTSSKIHGRLDVTNGVTFGTGILAPIAYRPEDFEEGRKKLAVWSIEGWAESWPEWNVQEFQFAISDRILWGARAIRNWGETNLYTWGFWKDYSWLDQLVAVIDPPPEPPPTDEELNA